MIDSNGYFIIHDVLSASRIELSWSVEIFRMTGHMFICCQVEEALEEVLAQGPYNFNPRLFPTLTVE